MSSEYRIYWQPGCSSCLRAKEFLKSHAIPFESINVLKHEAAQEELAALGARAIPVVAREGEFVFAQDLNDLADFLGVAAGNKRLPAAELVEKLDLVLAAAQRYARQLPGAALDTGLPGRQRSYRDLAYHIFMIPEGFLEAVQGGELKFSQFEKTPPADMRSGEQLAQFGQTVRDRFAAWWAGAGEAGLPNSVETYYGTQPTDGVLERTAWHAAQHTRQLMAVLSQIGISVDGALGERELAGLPLPDEVYDDEVSLSGAD